MSVRRLWPVLLLVPIGMLAGHQAVYELLHDQTVTGAHPHGHLDLLSTLAAPLALAGVVVLARGSARTSILHALVALAGAQALAFAAMEMAERLATGLELGELARSPLLWSGIAVQVGVALAFGLGGCVARRAAVSLLIGVTLGAGGQAPAPVPAATPPPEPAPRLLASLRWLLRRGPPLLLGP